MSDFEVACTEVKIPLHSTSRGHLDAHDRDLALPDAEDLAAVVAQLTGG